MSLYILPTSTRVVIAVAAASASCPALTQELGIQTPGPIVRAETGIATHLSYRDLRLASGGQAHIFAGIAHNGFAISGWFARGSAGARATEVLASYSYKLPLVDVHAGYSYVELNPVLNFDGRAWRLGLTSNHSEETQFEVIYDNASSGPYRSTMGRLTQRIYSKGPLIIAAQITTSRFEWRAGEGHGTSVALLMSRQINSDWELLINIHRLDSRYKTIDSPKGPAPGASISLIKSFKG